MVLLCAINISNIFYNTKKIDDKDSFNSSGNSISLYLSIILFIVTIITAVLSFYRIKFPRAFVFLNCFLFLLMATFFVNIISPNAYSEINNYVRFLLGLLFFYIFYHGLSRDNNIYMQLFVITFILQIAVKIVFENIIFYGSVSNVDFFSDSAAKSVPIIIPLIFLMFKPKVSFFFFLFCSAIVLFSTRRTAILGMMINFLLLWPIVKERTNKTIMSVFLIMSIVVVLIIWQYMGDALVLKMQDMLNGTKDYRGKVLYGSGRSDFWLAILNDYTSKPLNIFIGNGLGSVHEFYSRKYTLSLGHAHNDIIEIMYTFGLLGLFIWLSFFCSATKNINLNVYTRNHKLFICISVVYLFVALSSGTIFGNAFWVFTITYSLLLKSITTKKKEFEIL